MKAINRITEINKINKISKYSKYISGKLIPKVNETLNLNLKPTLSTDIYTVKYETLWNEDKDFLDITIKFTTNRVDLEGIFWGTFIIAGRSTEIGSLTGDLSYDIAIIEDTYYDFYEMLNYKGVKLPNISSYKYK